MKLTNRIENIAIAIIAAIIAITLTVAIMEMTSIKTLKKEIVRLDDRNAVQQAQILELAKIEKYKIENKFDQVKAKDGQIVLSLDNELSAVSLDTLKQKPPQPDQKQKKGLLHKLKFW